MANEFIHYGSAEYTKQKQTEILDVEHYRPLMQEILEKEAIHLDPDTKDFLLAEHTGVLEWVKARHLQVSLVFYHDETRYILPNKGLDDEQRDLMSGGHDQLAGEPVLVIRDIKEFCNAANLLSEVRSDYEFLTWTLPEDWDNGVSVSFLGATLDDFTHPESFFHRIKNHIQDPILEPLEYHYYDDALGTIPELEGRSLHVALEQADASYEAPYYVTFELISDEEKKHMVTHEGLLSGVRIARDGDKAYIYAIQKPKREMYTDTYIDDEQDHLISTALVFYEYFQGVRKFEGDDRLPKFFDGLTIPQQILDEKNALKFVVNLMTFLRQSRPQIYSNGEAYEQWLTSQKDVRNEMYSEESDDYKHRMNEHSSGGGYNFQYKMFRWSMSPFDILSDMERIEELEKLRDWLKQTPARKKHVDRLLYKVDDGLPPDEEYREYNKARSRGERPDFYPENVYDVPPAGVIALTSTLTMLRREGIEEVIFPCFLPFRWQDHLSREESPLYTALPEEARAIKPGDSEKIQHRQTEGLIRLVRRMETQIDGVQVWQLPDEEDKVVLRFTKTADELSSTNAILQRVIDISRAKGT